MGYPKRGPGRRRVVNRRPTVRGLAAVTNFNGTASLAATDALAAAGVVGVVATAAIAAAATLAAAGGVATSSSAAVAATATITADGVVGTSASAPIAAAAGITANGAVATSTSASLSATGTLTAGALVDTSSSASLSATDTLAADGAVGTSADASVAAVDTITADGTVAASSGAALAATGTITAAGMVVSGASAGGDLQATATITAAGTLETTATADLTATWVVTAEGSMAASGTADLSVAATITAAGHVGGTTPATRFLTVAAETRRLTVAAETRWLVVPFENRVQAITTGGVRVSPTAPVAASATASLATVATITADGTVSGSYDASASLAAVATIAASGFVTEPDFERAAPGTVGFLGDEGDLVEILVGGSLTGTPLAGLGGWDGDTFVATGNDVVIDGVKLHCQGLVHGSGTNMTVQDSVILCTPGGLFGVGQSNDLQGTLTITDCTVVCDTGPGTATYGVSIAGEGILIALRNDVSGSGDGIHANAQPGSFAASSRIEKNYIHDLSYLDEDQHLDAMQVFNADESNTSLPTYITIKGNYVDGQEAGPSGEAINSSLTMGRSPDGADEPPAVSAVIDNNYFGGGAFHLRIGYQTADVVVTNNNFGSLRHSPDPADEFDYADAEGGDIATWTNNRTGSGAAGTGTTIDEPGA